MINVNKTKRVGRAKVNKTGGKREDYLFLTLIIVNTKTCDSLELISKL